MNLRLKSRNKVRQGGSERFSYRLHLRKGNGKGLMREIPSLQEIVVEMLGFCLFTYNIQFGRWISEVFFFDRRYNILYKMIYLRYGIIEMD